MRIRYALLIEMLGAKAVMRFFAPIGRRPT
jgi:hypothetical protein